MAIKNRNYDYLNNYVGTTQICFYSLSFTTSYMSNYSLQKEISNFHPGTTVINTRRFDVSSRRWKLITELLIIETSCCTRVEIRELILQQLHRENFRSLTIHCFLTKTEIIFFVFFFNKLALIAAS